MDGKSSRPANGGEDSWEYRLRKYLLLLAMLVATVTYGAAFNPPGGVWEDSAPDMRRIAGDPIIRESDYPRYLVFFYSNATAFASSLVVIVLVLILAVLHERRARQSTTLYLPLRVLRVVMVLDLLSLMAAYAAGAFRDRLTAIYSLLLLAGVVLFLAVHMCLQAWWADRNSKDHDCASFQDRKDRKVLMLLATFAVGVTYVAGLSAPGGFRDRADGKHRPGDAVLKGGRHDARLKVFFVFNTTAFVASLLIFITLLSKKLWSSKTVRSFEYGFIAVTLVGLVGAYSAGSCRQVDTTIYVNSVVGAVIACILIQAAAIKFCGEAISRSCSEWLRKTKQSSCLGQTTQDPKTASDDDNSSVKQQQQTQALENARSLVLLLATLAAAITYQAGLNPPGGLWQGDGVGYMAGDPILLTMKPRRYKAFYYCNSVAFVASLVAIVLVRMKTLHHHNALEAAMVLDLFGLIGAYAAGSCRDVSTSIYAMAIAGAVLGYVVIHVVFFTLDHNDDGGGDDMKKRRKRLLLFAILAATISYQAGLTPPGGFLGKDDPATGHRAGDPVLLNNYERRYTAFFYCNSVSFMLSIALIILLVNPNLYRPAIRSNALSVCTAAGMIGIMGAYAAGSTQDLKTSIYIFALAGFVLFLVLLAVAFLIVQRRKRPDSKNTMADESAAQRPQTGKVADIESNSDAPDRSEMEAKKEDEDQKKKLLHAKRKYLMLLGILVASTTYQAGLAPPGGVWQSNDGGYEAGDPVMHDNRRHRYLAFFYSNSISFVASVVVMVLLLPEWRRDWWFRVMNMTVVLDLLGLLVAYAAGSSRSWKTTGYVSALVIAVLAYFVIHVVLSCFIRRGNNNKHTPNRNQEAKLQLAPTG